MFGLVYRACSNDSDQLTTLMLYKPIVRSQLEYATQVWSPHTKSQSKAIERVQRVAKFIVRKDLDYPRRLLKLGLLPRLTEERSQTYDFSSNAQRGFVTPTSNLNLISRPGLTQCETLRRSLKTGDSELTFLSFRFSI